MDEPRSGNPAAGWKIWVQAVRPFAFPASIVPVAIGAAAALGHEGAVRWELLPLALVGGVLFHAGTNFVSEYFDFLRGVDRPDTYGSSGLLVKGVLRPRQFLHAGLVTFALACAVSAALVFFRGWPIVWLALAALAGGFFYTGRPVGYKYVALGDLLVFILMGPLMVLGTHFVLTGQWSLRALGVSIPAGCLVAAILHANNLRDIEHDRRAGIRTLAGVLGLRGAKVEYVLLVGAAFAAVGVMAAAGWAGPWTLLVLLSLPPAVKNVRAILRARQGEPAAIATMDVKTAQHHLLFGLLLAGGLVLSAVI